MKREAELRSASQLSGANARRAEWEAAIYAGVVRRSYLKGYMKGKSCQTADEAALSAAEDVLGLSSISSTGVE